MGGGGGIDREMPFGWRTSICFCKHFIITIKEVSDANARLTSGDFVKLLAVDSFTTGIPPWEIPAFLFSPFPLSLHMRIEGEDQTMGEIDLRACVHTD